MDINNKIRDSFNPPPSLDGEDWLVPSSAVWDEIEKEIKPESKNRKGFLFFLIFGISMLLALLLFSGYYIFQLQESAIRTSERVSTTVIENTTRMDNSNLMEIADQNIHNKQQESVSIAKENSNYINYTENNYNRNIKPKGLSDNTQISSENNFPPLSVQAHSTALDLAIMPAIKENVPISSFDESNNSSHLSSDQVLSYKHDIIHMLPVENVRSLLVLNNTPTITPIIIKNIAKRNTEFSFLVGTSIWDINMNESYISALKPASFNAENGSGYFAQINLKKQLTSKFYLELNTSFDHVTFHSGHNSTVDYLIDNETNDKHENTFDLTMASPLGFIESNIIITREGDTENEQNLVVDLHNKHTIRTINSQFYFGYNLLQSNSLNANIYAGAGYNYILYNKNNLESFDIDNSGFRSTSSSIIANQKNINRLRPNFAIGSSISYSLNSYLDVILRYDYYQDMKNTFQFSDFSTKITRHHIGVGINYVIR